MSAVVPARDGGPTMTTKTVLEVPTGMQRIYRRFERWRSSHRGRLPIPKALWAAAAEVAREHGVFRTAKILHLEYGKLKRMAASATPVRRASTPPAAFLELVAPQGTPAGPVLTDRKSTRLNSSHLGISY